jgi:predicted TIM-barrel fold metal-dependent hydrolase
MYEGPIIDVDVHQEWKSQDDVMARMAPGWQDYVKGPGQAGNISMDSSSGYSNPHGFDREDSFPSDGSNPGSSPELMRKQLLDRFNIRRAVLTYGDVIGVSDFRNPYFATEVGRAATEWMMDFWLSSDERLYGSILIANGLPEVAAKEIRRLGDHPRIAQVLMAGNGIGLPHGHPLFHPIYEAAEEMGIPVALHGGGAYPTVAAGGTPNFYIEYHTLLAQPVMTSLISLITEGVFEKFPDLKVILVEGGVAWIPAIMWRFDTDYKGLRREVPWVEKLPSEYFRKNIKVSTQPFEISPKPEQMINVLSSIEAQDFLLFASDYPHWDSDDPMYIKDLLPEEWLPKILFDNALETYGWAREEVNPTLVGASKG